MRLIHGLLSFLSVPHRWARWMILRATLRLERLDYQLFEVIQCLPVPADLEEMRRFEVAETSSVRMASTLEEVQAEYLRPAIDRLIEAAQASDVGLRRELLGGSRER